MKENYVLTIKADDRPGLVHLVTGMINRRLIDIESLTAAKTDIRSVVLITIELQVSEKALTPLLLKLHNIIEVFEVEALRAAQCISMRTAYYKMERAFLETPEKGLLVKHGASIINLYPDAILIEKHGTDQVVQELLSALDGPYLMGFSQTGVIANSKLIAHDDIERIIGLAA